MCGPLAARTMIIEARRVSNWTVDIIIKGLLNQRLFAHNGTKRRTQCPKFRRILNNGISHSQGLFAAYSTTLHPLSEVVLRMSGQ